MNSSQKTIVIVDAINLALMLLFPARDSLPLWRRGTPTRDGFYFVYVPLLHIEVLWILINGTALWLLFREPAQRETDAS